MSIRELAAEADRIVATIGATVQDELGRSLSAAGLRELKRDLGQAQRELRDVKRRLTEEERTVRLAAQERRAKVASQGQILGLFVNSKARGSLARGRAASRQSIARQEASTLAPYRNVKAVIDRQLNDLQRLKERIDTQVEMSRPTAGKRPPPTVSKRPRAIETTSSTLRPAPPPPPTPAVWSNDPSGRHQLRYWDGSRWTDHVSDGGAQATDPL